MKTIAKILKEHMEWMLTGVGILLAAVTIWFLVWGVAALARNIGAALGDPGVVSEAEEFDLEAASQLDFRGLN